METRGNDSHLATQDEVLYRSSQAPILPQLSAHCWQDSMHFDVWASSCSVIQSRAQAAQISLQVEQILLCILLPEIMDLEHVAHISAQLWSVSI
jgi:hypothetical protein